MQGGAETHTAGVGEFQVQNHGDGGETAGGHAAFEQRTPHGADIGQGEQVKLERRANPKADAGHHHFLAVLLGLDDGARAVHEQRAGDDDQIAGHHGAGDAAEQAGYFGQKGEQNEDDADAVAHAPGGDAVALRKGDDAGVDDGRHGAGDAGEEVADAGAGQSALHLAKVHGLRFPVGDPLVADGLAVGLDGNDDAEKQERGQQRPERNAEVDADARPFLGDAHPGSAQHRAEIVDAKGDGHDAAGHNANQRCPQAQGRRGAQGQGDDDDQRHQGGQGGGYGVAHRLGVQQVEYYRRQGDG